MLNTRHPAIIAALAGSLVATAAVADHNSVWGAGTANMPNDIHNTRIEQANTGLMSAEEWREFVRKGAGAATVNRYLDEDGDGIADRDLPSATTRNSGAEQSAQVKRGSSRDDTAAALRAANAGVERGDSFARSAGMIDRPSPAMREMNFRVERPAYVNRGGRR
jgi:hypothetical protein